MKKRLKKRAVIFIAAVLTLFLLYFVGHTERYRVRHEVLKLAAAAGITKQDIGFQLYDVTKNKYIYSLNKNNKFAIASINKIFTASTILYYMAPDFTFSTVVASVKPDKKGMVNGPLYIIGSGDPLFSYQNMDDLVSKMYATGIKKIKGDIILDNTLFKPKRMDEGTLSTVSTSPALVNLNLAQLKRSSLKGKPIYIDPYGCMETLVNEPQLVNVPVYPENISAHIESPVDYYMCVLKYALAGKKIKFSGKIRLGVYEHKEPVLFNVDSNSVRTVLNYMLKESSNLVAEQMLQVVAAYKVPSEKEHELKLVDGFLTNMIGVNEEDLALSDASGLSYQTKATPSAIIRTLNSMYKNNNYDFLNALPVSGIDGTLKDFTNYKIKGKIKAKTGTLLDSGVRGLAGYIEAGHDVYSFVLIVNSPNSRDMSFYEQDLLEKIVSILEN